MMEPVDNSNVSEPRPLEGTCVMVTRAEEPSDPLARELRRLGAEVVVQPAIRISPPADWRPVDDALERLQQFDWLVFSSANGVRYLLGRAAEKGTGPICRNGPEGAAHKLDLSPFPRPRIAAMGPGTAAAVAGFGLHVDRVPAQFRAEALAEELLQAERGTGPICRNGPEGAAHKLDLSPFPLAGRRFLLARASRGRDVLARRLNAAGATVEQIVVYTSADVEQPEPEIAAMLRAGRIGWVTVTSSAIARSLGRLFGGQLRQARLASISPLTSGVLRELGYQPAVEAAEYTLAGLVAAIVAGTQEPA
jgi:uroporphyrinogen III methyltransferase/synthase